MHSYRIKALYLIVFLITLGACSQQKYSVAEVEGKLLVIKEIEPEPELKTLILPYKEKLDAEMNEIIGVSEIEMEKNKPEGLLGNFIADLLLEIANKHYKESPPIDFCLINNGGFRTSLPKGEITRKKIFELMPFENELVVITLDQEALGKMFTYLSEKGGGPISGFKLGIEKNGGYTLDIKNSNGFEERNYKVLTSDYLADGGSNMTFFADSLKKEVLGIKVRDAIIEHIITQTKEGKTLNKQLDNRIYYAE